jgi:hypothetical protein
VKSAPVIRRRRRRRRNRVGVEPIRGTPGPWFPAGSAG